MKKKLLYMLIFCISYSPCVYSKNILPMNHSPQEAQDVWILVHGTFANKAARIIPRVAWWKENQPFYNALKQALTKKKISFSLNAFIWSGSLQHEKRVQAGMELAGYIIKNTKPHQKIHIVAHSHGGNVALLAAGFLQEAQAQQKISYLFTLGTPIGPSYTKTAHLIGRIDNLYSYGDLIQPVFNMFKRVFEPAKHIYNIQVRFKNHCPTHIQLHDACIASCIPLLSTLITDTKPYVISLFSDKDPLVTLDTTREEDLVIDEQFRMQLIMSLAESKKRGHTAAIEYSKEIKRKLKNWIVRLRDRRNLNT